jgi:hypothetical protein
MSEALLIGSFVVRSPAVPVPIVDTRSSILLDPICSFAQSRMSTACLRALLFCVRCQNARTPSIGPTKKEKRRGSRGVVASTFHAALRAWMTGAPMTGGTGAPMTVGRGPR